MIAVRRKNWIPSKYNKLCSTHFPEDMIDRTSLSCVSLHENAVPSILDFYGISANRRDIGSLATFLVTWRPF